MAIAFMQSEWESNNAGCVTSDYSSGVETH